MNDKLRILKTVIAAELLKSRNTVALWLTLLYPLGSVFLTSLFLYAQRDQVKPDMVVFMNNFNGLVSFFLPFYAVLMISFFCQLEHRNSMLKHLFALPVPKWAYYYGKLLAIMLLALVAGFILLTLIYFSLFILGLVAPKLQITSLFEHGYLLKVLARTFISAIALIVIQYLISMKLKNVVVAVSIGISLIILPVAILFVLGITGLVTNPGIFKWLPKYDPYSFPYSHAFNLSGGAAHQDFYSTSLIIWLGIAVTLAIAGYEEIKRRNIK